MGTHSHPLFTDSQFPIERFDETLPDSLQNDGIRWIRPFQIVKNPKFFSDDTLQEPFKRRHEVIKGLNGGFFLAAVAGLTGYKDKFGAVVIPVYKTSKTVIMFRFQFFEEEGSEPREVVIDDRLPTINGKLVFAQAPGDVFWCPLLEKAYAKFRGGYNQLNLGDISTALTHLTGQQTLPFLTSHVLPSVLYSRFSELMKKEQILCCKHKHYNNNNLDYGGAYTITGIRQSVTDYYQIRIRDVAADKEEWISFRKFKMEYDVVFVTIGAIDGEDERGTSRRLKKFLTGGVVLLLAAPLLLGSTPAPRQFAGALSTAGRLFDEYGRYMLCPRRYPNGTARTIGSAKLISSLDSGTDKICISIRISGL